MTTSNNLPPENDMVDAEDTSSIGAASSQADGLDDWAAALAEQNAATQQVQEHVSAEPATNAVFKPLKDDGHQSSLDIEALKDVPLQMTVELGRTRLTIRELLQLGQGSVVELAGLAGEPMDILINGHLIAQGEVVVVGDNYGVRLTDILTPSDRLQRLTMPR